MLSVVHAVVVYLVIHLSVYVCVSVALRYCVKTAKQCHTIGPGLVFKWDVL